jgi:hypothetical protein
VPQRTPSLRNDGDSLKKQEERRTKVLHVALWQAAPSADQRLSMAYQRFVHGAPMAYL